MIILVSDTSVLIDLERGGYVLVTGDGELRAEAMSRLGKVYGLLWLLDQIAASGAIAKPLLYEGLERIAAHPRCRLPRLEVTARLNSWGEVVHHASPAGR